MNLVETAVYWMDNNKNRWLKTITTEGQAEAFAQKMHCSTCCCNSYWLGYCDYCIDCNNCNDSAFCVNCSFCYDCEKCKRCSYCEQCQDCIDCYGCRDYIINPRRYTAYIQSFPPITFYYGRTKKEMSLQIVVNDLSKPVSLENYLSSHKIDYLNFMTEYQKEFEKVKALFELEA